MLVKMERKQLNVVVVDRRHVNSNLPKVDLPDLLIQRLEDAQYEYVSAQGVLADFLRRNGCKVE